jgi:hypothetical protein
VAHHPVLITRRSVETEPLGLGEQFLDVASLLKCGLNGPILCHTKMPFSGSWAEGFTWDRLQRFIAGINRRPNLCPPGTGPARLRQEGKTGFAARSLTCFKFRFVSSPLHDAGKCRSTER